MSRYRAQQQASVDEPEPNPQGEDHVPDDEQQDENDKDSQPSEPKGDYLNVASRPFLMKILQKQGYPFLTLLLISIATISYIYIKKKWSFFAILYAVHLQRMKRSPYNCEFYV